MEGRKVAMTGSKFVFRQKSTFDVNELSAFYVKHKSTLVSHASRMVMDKSHAEELVQETMVKLLLVAPDLKSEAQAFAYVRKAIDNSIIDHYRLNGRRPALVSITDATSEIENLSLNQEDHSEQLILAEDALIVREALSLLSPAERAALVMWEIQGRSSKEIASELGIKESSVRHTVSRARSSLRKVLSQLILDEKLGLTALDLLSKSYRKVSEVSKNSGRIALSLILILAMYFSFENFLPEVKKNQVREFPKSNPAMEAVEQNAKDSLPRIPLGIESSEETKSKGDGLASAIKNARSSSVKVVPIRFPGLDGFGIPSGFTVSDSTGSLGSLMLIGKEAQIDDLGLSIPSIAKTSSGAASIFLSQLIRQDSAQLTYEVTPAYGKDGRWIPLNSKVTNVESERLGTGQYLLSATIAFIGEIKSPISIPATTGGRDLNSMPKRVQVKILLDSSKLKIVGEAVQVVETTS